MRARHNFCWKKKNKAMPLIQTGELGCRCSLKTPCCAKFTFPAFGNDTMCLWSVSEFLSDEKKSDLYFFACSASQKMLIKHKVLEIIPFELQIGH